MQERPRSVGVAAVRLAGEAEILYHGMRPGDRRAAVVHAGAAEGNVEYAIPQRDRKAAMAVDRMVYGESRVMQHANAAAGEPWQTALFRKGGRGRRLVEGGAACRRCGG